MLVSWLSLAWAAEIDLARATRALAEGRPDEAFQHARTALDDNYGSMEAWLTWLAACEAAGVGDACRAGASMLGEEERVAVVAAVWHDIQLDRLEPEAVIETIPELEALDLGLWNDAAVPRAQAAMLATLVEADPDAAASKGLELLSNDRSHPEVLIPLFRDGLPARSSLGKARKKLVGTGSKAMKKASTEELYRWHEVFVATASADLAQKSADRLAEAGEPRPLPRYPWTRAQSVQAARALMSEPGPFPDIVPSEREAVALRLAEMLGSAGRHEETAERLTEARAKLDSASLAIAHGEALLSAGDLDGAAQVANDALRLSSEPWPTDIAAGDRLGRRTGLAKSYGLRGRVALARADHGSAAIDLMVANQLAIQPVDTGALEKAMAKGRYALEAKKLELETASEGASTVALDRARRALEEGDTATVSAAASDAIAVLCLPTHRSARLTARMAFAPELASAFALRALAEQKEGDAASSLIDVTTALLLLPFNASEDWWGLAEDLHAAAGREEAAFFASAMRQSIDPEAPASTISWQASEVAGSAAAASMVAGWMRGNEQIEPNKDRLKIQRGRVIQFRAPSGGGTGAATVPVINKPFPAWTITDSEGTITHQKGRIEVITFFRTDSPNSLRLLDEVTDLARRLRMERGVNVALFGICMDAEPGSLEGMRARRDSWGTTKWDPELGKRMGVSAFPTTWIVDAEGFARFKHVGYLGGSDYDAEIRFITGN